MWVLRAARQLIWHGRCGHLAACCVQGLEMPAYASVARVVASWEISGQHLLQVWWLLTQVHMCCNVRTQVQARTQQPAW